MTRMKGVFQDRMAINAAIEKLIALDDASGDAARTVIVLCDDLRERFWLSGQYNRTETTSGDSVTGATQHGNLTIKDGERTEHKEGEFGIHKERIGHYRVWKEQDGVVGFHHYWASSTTTEGSRKAVEYWLGYDPESKEPLWFGRRRVRVAFRIGWLHFTTTYTESLVGTAPASNSYGVHITNAPPDTLDEP